MEKVQPIPEGYHSVTPVFMFKDSNKAIEFYQEAFGAQVLDLMLMPDGGSVMHATLKIGNSILMLSDEMPGNKDCAKSAETLGYSPISLYVYVANVDEAFNQAIAAGGTASMPVADMFWGDRVGQIKDPFGYLWMIATHNRDLTTEQIKKGSEEFIAAMAKTASS